MIIQYAAHACWKDECSIVKYKKSAAVRVNIKKNAGELFLSKGFNKVKITDIAQKSGVAKGTVLYHFTSKDDLLYEIIEDIISAELTGLVAYVRKMPADHALLFLFTVMFAGKKPGSIQQIIDDKELFAKCHGIIDQIRRKIVMPVFKELVAQGMSEGLLEVEDPEISCAILGYGFEGFIHNNFQKFKDIEFQKRFIKTAEMLCNKILKPKRIKFEFNKGINHAL